MRSAGDTLRLASGDYGAISLDGDRNTKLKFAGDVTVTSANPGAPAVIRDLDIRGVTNLNFDNIDFTGAAGRTSGDLVSVTASRGITISNSDFDGRSGLGGVQQRPQRLELERHPALGLRARRTSTTAPASATSTTCASPATTSTAWTSTACASAR